MNSIASEAHFRQRVLKYSFNHGVTEASRRFHVSRNAIYEWRAKYGGTWHDLKEKIHRPHHHPNEHTQEEKELILRQQRTKIVCVLRSRIFRQAEAAPGLHKNDAGILAYFKKFSCNMAESMQAKPLQTLFILITN